MAEIVKFVSQSEINAKKEQKRKAREETIRQAKDEYEREERLRVKREESGETSWMLPSVSQRIASDDEDTVLKKKKSKREKKLKKAKKHKKKQQKKPKDEASSEELKSGDEWVEKSATIAPVADLSQTTQVQRDSWMLCPPISINEKSSFEEELVGDAFKGSHPEKEEEKEDKKLSCIDQPGQHPKELNPYWKDGGVGLPAEDRQSSAISGPGKGNWDIKWLRKSYQRAKEQAEEEGGSVEDIVSQRWGSLERLETMIKQAEERDESAKREEATRRREKDRSYDRDRGRDRYKDSNRDMDRGRYKDRDSERDRDSNRSKDRDSGRDRNGDRDRDRDRSKDWDSGRDRGKERALDRDKDRDRSKESKERQRLFEREKWQKRPEQETTTSTRYLRPSDTAASSSFVGTFKRPQSERPTTSSSSSSWDFSSPSASVTAEKSHAMTAGGWRKKTTEGTSCDKKSDASDSRQMEQEAVVESSSESEGSSGGEDDEGQEDTEQKRPAVPQEKITEAKLNQMGAEILRAELMGDEV